MSSGYSAPLCRQHVAGARLLADREAMVALLPKDGIVAEVGTETGRFAERILALARPRALHLIDNDWSLFEHERLALPIARGEVRLHRGQSSECLAGFPDHTFDWIYIDADHTLAGVARDLAIAKRKIRPAGILALNDYTRWTRKAYEYGIMPAVNALIVAEGWRVVYLALDRGGYNDIAIARGATG